jgi:hypothetical protein
MDRYGRELHFISRISGDGKKLKNIENEEVAKHLNQQVFIMNCLSISNQTFIASAMSTYVVRLKNPRLK